MFGKFDAKYSGIRIIFGCTGIEGEGEAQARPLAEQGEMHQWFGDGCYTLVSTGGGAWPHSCPDCLLIVYRCARAHSPHHGRIPLP
jgi:hypothetical protein